MKIIFVSPMHGQAGLTCNMTATALMAGLIYKKKSLITQTLSAFNNLEAPILGSNSYNVESKDFYLDVGLDALVRNFKSDKLNKATVENCCITIPQTKVSLLPGTAKASRESFEYEMGMVGPKLFQDVEDHFDVVFIDASSIQSDLSKLLMENADLVVVNLSQNLLFTKMFINIDRPEIKSKIFYLFGSYDEKSKYNINNIRRRFKEINNKNSGVIPYCTGYKDAQVDCNVVGFFKDNINCTNKDENYFFIRKAISTTEKMLKMAGLKLD